MDLGTNTKSSLSEILQCDKQVNFSWSFFIHVLVECRAHAHLHINSARRPA
jgi:hypothetical protein